MSKVDMPKRYSTKSTCFFQSSARSLEASQKPLPWVSLLEDTHSSKDLDGLISKSQTHGRSDLLRTVSKDSTISGAQDYTKACLKSPEKPALLNPGGTCTPVTACEAAVSFTPMTTAATEWKPHGEALAWLLRRQKAEGRHFGVIHPFCLQLLEIAPNNEVHSSNLGASNTAVCSRGPNCSGEKNRVPVSFVEGKTSTPGTWEPVTKPRACVLCTCHRR